MRSASPSEQCKGSSTISRSPASSRSGEKVVAITTASSEMARCVIESRQATPLGSCSTQSSGRCRSRHRWGAVDPQPRRSAATSRCFSPSANRSLTPRSSVLRRQAQHRPHDRCDEWRDRQPIPMKSLATVSVRCGASGLVDQQRTSIVERLHGERCDDLRPARFTERRHLSRLDRPPFDSSLPGFSYGAEHQRTTRLLGDAETHTPMERSCSGLRSSKSETA